MGETKIVTYSSETMKGWGIGEDDMYKNGEYLMLQTFMKRDDICMDVGANSGKYTHALLSVTIPKMVYCFEPLSPIFEQLYKKFFYRSNVKMFNNAVMHENANAKFFYYKNNPEMSNFFGRPEVEEKQHLEKEEIIVTAIKLDDFIDNEKIEKIDYLKADCEGSELYVIKGCEKALSESKIKILQFEYGGGWIDSKMKLKDAFGLLSKYGYSVYRIFNEGLIYFPQWYDELENYGHSNMLAISSDKGKELFGDFEVRPMIFNEVVNDQKI